MYKKIILITVILCFSSINLIRSEEFKMTDNDVEKFLTLADGFVEMASKYISEDQKNLKLSEIFYLDNKKLLAPTEKYLKKNGWSFEKMNDFLYTAGVILDAISYYDVYGGEEDNELTRDISKDSIPVVRKYKDKLIKYFNVSNYEDINLGYDNELDSDTSSTNVDYSKTDENVVNNRLYESNNESNDSFGAFIGAYKMDIQNDTKRGLQDSIYIKNISNGLVEGEIVVDWDIGPEARTPMDWEATYRFPFKYKLNGNNLKFKVVVAEKYITASEYDFDLILLMEHNATPIISGNVRITLIKNKSYSDYVVRADKK